MPLLIFFSSRLKFLFLSIFLTLIISSSSFNFEKIKFKNYVYNPYRVFSLPPWTSMKKIKQKYHELILKYHPDKSHADTSEQFQLIQQSYEEIKKKRKGNEESDTEISITTVIQDTVKSIINVELIFLLIYIISFIIYKLQLLVIVPIFYQIMSFVLVDNLIPHWFDEQGGEIACGFIGGIILMIFHTIIKKICGCSKKQKIE